MIFPNSLVKLAWLPKLLRDTKPQTYDISFSAMPPPGLSLTWRDWGNASFKTVTLPPTVDTLCASDHYPRFLPGSHFLCELIFVVWVRHEIFQLVACAGNTTLASSLHHQSETESCNRWRRSIKSVLEVPRTCWKRSIKSVFDVPRITESWKKHILYIYKHAHDKNVITPNPLNPPPEHMM